MNTSSLKSQVRNVANFPKKGVNFLDISPLLNSAPLFQDMIQHMGAPISWHEIDAIVGIESRGFILASALATKHNKGLILCRKQGKLPPPVIAESYKLEYGEAILEIAPGSGRVLIVDDVLATGGTLAAASNICAKAGYHVQDLLVLIDIRFLNKMKFKDKNIKSVLQYD